MPNEITGVNADGRQFGLAVSDPCHSFGEDANETRKVFPICRLLST
jgi:hypothetical protein